MPQPSLYDVPLDRGPRIDGGWWSQIERYDAMRGVGLPGLAASHQTLTGSTQAG